MFELSKKEKWWLFIVVALVSFIIGRSCAKAQTPPVSTITGLPDTVTSLSFGFSVDVKSDIPWDTGGGIGFYYRVSEAGGWRYSDLSGSYGQYLEWEAPYDEMTYDLSTQVTDNEGNAEDYHIVKATVYVCSRCCPENCPPPTMIRLAHDAAVLGVTQWGQANEIQNEWWWAHADSGTAAVYFEGELDVGGTVTFISPISVQADSSWSFLRVPRSPGQTQRLRVRGVDSASVAGPYSLWGVYEEGIPGQTSTPEAVPVLKEVGQ